MMAEQGFEKATDVYFRWGGELPKQLGEMAVCGSYYKSRRTRFLMGETFPRKKRGT